MKQLSCLFLLSIFLFSCEKLDVPDGTPSCIKQKIRKMENDPERYGGLKIERWDHEGKSYYLFPPPRHSADMYVDLFDPYCEYVCSPYGGIHGNGSGTCPDLTGHTETVIYVIKE